MPTTQQSRPTSPPNPARLTSGCGPLLLWRAGRLGLLVQMLQQLEKDKLLNRLHLYQGPQHSSSSRRHNQVVSAAAAAVTVTGEAVGMVVRSLSGLCLCWTWQTTPHSLPSTTGWTPPVAPLHYLLIKALQQQRRTVSIQTGSSC